MQSLIDVSFCNFGAKVSHSFESSKQNDNNKS